MPIKASDIWCRFEVNAVLGSYPPYSFAFIVMLCTLVSMHVYWFALIARIAWLKDQHRSSHRHS